MAETKAEEDARERRSKNKGIKATCRTGDSLKLRPLLSNPIPCIKTVHNFALWYQSNRLDPTGDPRSERKSFLATAQDASKGKKQKTMAEISQSVVVVVSSRNGGNKHEPLRFISIYELNPRYGKKAAGKPGPFCNLALIHTLIFRMFTFSKAPTATYDCSETFSPFSHNSHNTYRYTKQIQYDARRVQKNKKVRVSNLSCQFATPCTSTTRLPSGIHVSTLGFRKIR